MAEYFRDVQARTCCSSSTTSSASPRPAPRCRRCSAACRRPWATSRRWPTRWASCRSASPRPSKGSITSVQAIYVPADDYTDPAPATTFAHLDATTVLSRAISDKGIYPAVDPLDSTSRILAPESSAPSTTTSPARCSGSCSATRTCRTSSPSSAWTSCPKRTSSRCIARPQDRALPVALQEDRGRDGRRHHDDRPEREVGAPAAGRQAAAAQGRVRRQQLRPPVLRAAGDVQEGHLPPGGLAGARLRPAALRPAAATTTASGTSSSSSRRWPSRR
jgi:hypothetical protein